jgi:lysophospholipase L1-like esterase
MESGPLTESSKQEADEPQIQLTTGKKLAFAVIASLMGIFAIEGAGRLVGYPSGAVRTLSKIGAMDRKTFDESVGMWRPNFKGRVSWPVEIAYNVTINKHGFRGPEFVLKKQAKVFRILCLGDSTTFCSYVKEGLTYPEMLAKELQKDFPNVEVINGGHPAWGTSDQLRFLKERGFKIQPDLIVHLFCGNDPTDIQDPTGKEGNYARKLRRIDKGLSVSDTLRFHTAIGEMETRLHVAWKQWRGKNRAHSFTPYGIKDQQWSLYKQSYTLLASYCKEQKIPLITSCFPGMRESKGEGLAMEKKVCDIARALGVPVIPMTAAFRAAEDGGAKLYWMPIDTHANEEGCEVLAAELAKAMKAQRIGPYKQK